MDNPFKSPSVISFCPGFLGLERGVKRAIGELNIVAYSEIEAFIIENLIAGMEAGLLAPAPIWSDVKTFPARQFSGKVYGLLAGYPCQPFSNSGERKGEDDPRHLYPFIEKSIEAIRPVWCFFENVAGHLSLGFDHVYKSLQRLGYAVEAGLFTAAEVGAPHERKRLFILAVEHTVREHIYRSGILRTGWGQFTNNGKPLANADNNSVRSGSAQIQGAAEEVKGAARQQNWQWVRYEFGAEGGLYSGPVELSATERQEMGNASCQSGQSAGATGLDMERDALFKAGRNKGTNGIETSGNEVANSDNQGLQESGQGGERKLSAQVAGQVVNRFEQRSNEVADSDESGLQERGVERRNEDGQFTTSVRGRELPDAQGVGMEGVWPTGQCITAVQAGEVLFRCDRKGDRWPAKPGQRQHEWEHARTITKDAESGLGLAINGYRFREDILRALGNSVVEQQAEKAFIHLLKQQFGIDAA